VQAQDDVLKAGWLLGGWVCLAHVTRGCSCLEEGGVWT
jgi:hypothetical protein